jgi:ergothioneine biosynthesis protein EgtB
MSVNDTPLPPPIHHEATLERYKEIRAYTEELASALSPEDQCIQSMPDASPVKWHRAHTTWFFEEFVLAPFRDGYRIFDQKFRFLFNSYYEAVGPRHPRPSRGLLTRPSVTDIGRYRAHVDAAMAHFYVAMPESALNLVELGLQHEQQHQELLLTDILHAFSMNPLAPAMNPRWTEPASGLGSKQFRQYPGGLVRVGHTGDGFCFDNEGPAHMVYLGPFEIATHLVRNRDWLAFIVDGGYRTPSLWMADAWTRVQTEGWSAPLYWQEIDGSWHQMGPGGLAELDFDAPVRNISWYEADAFARWAGARLPSEEEWELASHSGTGLNELTGHVWQWTGSAYRPYPGYRPAPGAVGEYNGKFMIGQMVLRGGSWATPAGHTRPSYRNFFHPEKRWQYAGLRLARTI